MQSKFFTLALALLIALAAGCAGKKQANVLVFSKTASFRHESIEAGIAALQKMATEKDFKVSFTEDAAEFNSANLKNYNAVIFLNTTGDVLDNTQQEAFERFIQAGGGYVGIHAATDTEYDWYWYGRLAGAYFLDHPSDPNVQEGTMVVKEHNHWATEGMPDKFQKTDEFYNFKDISDKINVVLTIDESTYNGGKNGEGHPMSWYQEFDGGRSFYTAMGHTSETFSEPLFLNHLWAGIHYAVGGDKPQALDYSKAKPEENRFTKVVLAEKLDEPMELALLDEERILFIERKGAVKLFNTSSNTLTTIANIPVSTKYVNKEGKESEAEDGLLGLAKDPNFAQNNWIYIYYSTPARSSNILSRFEMKGDELLLETEKEILEVAVQREECCHAGGSITFDKSGNLYLSTGDNTNPHASNGYSPSDERPDRSPWDAQKSSANTNDLRGKIIRITPQPDGSYTIPDGNLFPKGTDKTRPEIYTMGHRNPFRISVDSRTGYVYWGDVGPDASAPDSTRGPAGHDEVGQARKPGNFGWPHFVGDNKAYTKYDFVNQVSLTPWDAAAPVNTSPNNTGLQKLPPAQKAFIWYPYGASPEFPLVGDGGRNAMAGPVFYSDDFKGAERAFPAYYDKKLFAYDWMRGWIMSVTMNEAGDLVWMERFMPSYKFSNPMDMEFAANGDLYMLEYGTGWFTQNDDARLIRIEYNAGNRKPQLMVNPEKMGGDVPFTMRINTEGTTDPDGDELTYKWVVTSEGGFKKEITGPALALTVDKPGIYNVNLTVDDGAGGVITQAMEMLAGNEMPIVKIQTPGGNRTFYSPGKPIAYDIAVTDKEDGSLGQGIDAARVALNFDYFPEGFDKIQIAQGHRSADEAAMYAKGKNLMADSDCAACHKVNEKSIGPSYTQVAERYKDDKTAEETLAGRIIKGTSGNWGETAMAAHPQLSTADAAEMVKYILSLSKAQAPKSLFPLKGNYVPKIPDGDPGTGVIVVRAAYEDNGSGKLPALQSEETLVLRNAQVGAHHFDEMSSGIQKMSFGGNNLAIVQGSDTWMKINQIDLNNVKAITAVVMLPTQRLNAQGGSIEVHLGSASGPVIGQSAFLQPKEGFSAAPDIVPIPITLPANEQGKLHDVVLVFKNPAVKDRASLMILLQAIFNI